MVLKFYNNMIVTFIFQDLYETSIECIILAKNIIISMEGTSTSKFCCCLTIPQLQLYEFTL